MSASALRKASFGPPSGGPFARYNVIRLNTRTGEIVRCSEDLVADSGYPDGCETILGD